MSLTLLSWCPNQTPADRCDPCQKSVCGWSNVFPGGLAGGNNSYQIPGTTGNPSSCSTPNVHLIPQIQIGGIPGITGMWTVSGPPLFSQVGATAEILLNGASIFNASVQVQYTGQGDGFFMELDDTYLSVPLPPFPWTLEFRMSGPGSPQWEFTPTIEAKMP